MKSAGRVIGRVAKLAKVGQQYLVVSIAPEAPLPFKPGQYVTWEFHDQAGSFFRPFSVANAPGPLNILEFCLQLKSADERLNAAINQLALQQSVMLSEARGNFYVEDSGRPLVFIAGGSGIAPFRAFLQDLSSYGNKAAQLRALVYGCRDAGAMPFIDEFLPDSAGPRPQDLKIFLRAEVGGLAMVEKGNILAGLDDFLRSAPEPLVKKAHYYLCGPPGMVDAVRRTLEAQGIATGDIFQERFSP